MDIPTIVDWHVTILHHSVPPHRLSVYSAPELHRRRATAHIQGTVGDRGVLRTSPIIAVAVLGDKCTIETASGNTYALEGMPISAYRQAYPGKGNWSDALWVQRFIQSMIPSA